MNITKRIGMGIAGAVVTSLLLAGAAFAVFGSKLADFQPTPSGNGRAVAFDGTTLYYTLYPDAGNIYTTSPANVAGPTLVTAPALQWGALAWDSVNSQLWGARYGDSVADFYTIDEVTGLAALQFTFAFPAGESCYPGVDNPDGLAYDATDNTLWISDDAATKVYHVDTSGAVLGSFTVPNGKCNTGLAVNGKYLWMAVQSGADLGPHDIYRVDKTNPTVVLSTLPWGVVNNPGPEDLELDLVTYAPEHCALWSNQFGANNRLVAWELEKDLKPECSKAITLDPPTASNPSGSDHTVTATVTQGGNPLAGVLVSFSVVSGPNIGEASGPGECSTDPNCNTDAAGQTSWTYTSNGTVGTDVIEACFTDEAGDKRCVRVEKEWESLPGRMTGGGTIPAGKLTLEGKHGFELHCDAADLPNRLEVNWGKGNRFHLETLTSAVCENDPTLDEQQPVAGFDTYKGTGTGRLNGVSGATAEWTFTDDGEPGVDDYATIKITQGLNTYEFSGNLKNGNQQAHP